MDRPLRDTRSARIAIAIGLVGCLAAAGCGSKTANGAGHVGAIAVSAPAQITSSPAASPGGAGPTGGAGSATGGATSGAPTSGQNGAPRVTLVVDAIKPAVVATDKCPYLYTLRATVSVDKGPIDLKYAVSRVNTGAVAQPIHFGGTGPQSKVLTFTLDDIGYDEDLGRAVLILDKSGKEILRRATTFHLTCGARPADIAPLDPPKSCPYNTAFTATLTAAVPEHATYEWHLGDGTVVKGEMDVFGSNVATSIAIPDVHVTPGLTGTYHLTLKVTSPGGGTVTGSVQCPTGANK